MSATVCVYVYVQLLPSDFAEFSDWLGTLSSQSDHAYLERIIRTDLIPCLTFKNEKVDLTCHMTDIMHMFYIVGK